MTYSYTCPHCGASLKIETDQAAMAIQHIKDYEKKHKCKMKKNAHK